MNRQWCESDVPFIPTHCAIKLSRPTITRETVSLTISTINLSECRRCHQRRPLPYCLESTNGHVSLRICADCFAILDSLQPSPLSLTAESPVTAAPRHPASSAQLQPTLKNPNTVRKN